MTSCLSDLTDRFLAYILTQTQQTDIYIYIYVYYAYLSGMHSLLQYIISFMFSLLPDIHT